MKNPCPHIDDPIDATLCANCIALRRQSGRTREQLAEATGIRARVLSDMEEGRDFDMRALHTLCRFYGLTLRNIFRPLDVPDEPSLSPPASSPYTPVK